VKSYQFLLREEAVVEFGRRTSAERDELLRRFYFLGTYPEHQADECYSGQHGEEIRQHRFGRWRITYQIDSPVRQIHILEFKKLPK